MKNIKYILYWIGLTTYIIVALSFSSKKQSEVKYDNIDVIIESPKNAKFIDSTLIISALYKSGYVLKGQKRDSLNLPLIKKMINNHSPVKETIVYGNDKGALFIEVKQREPIIRIINYNGESYYIDKEGKLMPLSYKYTARVPIVTGHINEPFDKYADYNNVLEYASELKNNSIVADVYKLAKFLQKNKFWKYQILQIYIDRNNDFILIPRVGNHEIILGDITNFEEKFEKLKILYKEGLTVEGFNKYKYINLKFDNQIVCTKY